MDLLRDVWNYLKVRKKWWLLPILLVFGFFALLVALAANPAAAPLVYTLW